MVRIVLAISLDGRLAMSSGGKAMLGGGGDKRALEKALAWSDATLMGGGTLRAHRSTCLIHDSDLVRKRVQEGRTEQPISLLVSRERRYQLDWRFFDQPIQRWLLSPLEVRQGASHERDTPIGFSRQLPLCGDWKKTIFELADFGLSRLVLLGGAQLIASFLKADVVDELQLTISPRLLGGTYTWVPTALENLPNELQSPEAWLLKGTEMLGGNELILRYFRNRSVNLSMS